MFSRFHTTTILAITGLYSLALISPATAQGASVGYADCDVHMVNSTTCGHRRISPTNTNYSSLQVRERNDKVGLTYLSLECNGDGSFAIFLESKNPLVSQRDFDSERTPNVLLRVDNGALRALKVANAQQLSADGTAFPDLNTLEIDPQGTFDAVMKARNRVQLVVQRLGGWSTLTYDFPTFGFAQTFKTLNSCESQ